MNPGNPFKIVIFRKIFEMVKNIMIVLLSLAASGTLSAQANRQFRNNGMSAATGNFFSEMRKKKDAQSSISETVGTPYIEESFKPCEVYYGNELVGTFFYRHNAYNDEIEIKDSQIPGDEVTSLATMRELRLVDLESGNELSLMTYENKDEQMRNGYLYELKDGEKYHLLFKKNVKFTEGTKPANPLLRPTPNKFSKFVEYYYFTDDSKVAQYVPTRKGKFLRSFSDKEIQEKLKQFLKEEDINLNREEDLVRVFKFLDQQA